MCKLFAWLLVQNKILTADNLAVWEKVLDHYNFNFLQQVKPSDYRDTCAWWIQASKTIDKERRQYFNGVVIYIMWNIWKERNRRIFQTMAAPAFVVASLARDAIDTHRLAFHCVTVP
ncbi:hypothetical protein BRADI_3g23451v3 [Brachypodium distachyon]|uniref:Reverse transcriptase zinc-binding domain-containing protein n=1 Tax=Brachypodium distachyon TaxID=15368 RepID=A0A2K2CZ43_BRADI|nr:hypothetical protein BRADI_3g23451v3 [Brachypodium distachyon]